MEDENKTMGMNRLLTILSEGADEMRRLSSHLNEQLRADAMNVQSRFSQAIDIVNSMEATGMHQMPSQGHTTASGSPGGSFSGSPSEGSERIVKKRKGTVKRTINVQGTVPDDGQPDTALVPDDGFSWRKYGQKSILNAKHPRSYYRCTFQKNQNCEALKQVQRSDEDPTIFVVTYQGEHTCTQHVGKTQSLEHQLLIPMQNESDEHVMINFNNSNNPIGTHESVHDDQSKIVSPSFSISSTQAGLRSEIYNVFSPSSTSFGAAFSSGGAFSSGFVSSGASDSNYLSVFQSPFGADFGGGSSFHGSESELNDVISLPHSSISTANDFTVEQPPFPFDSPDPFK